MSHTYDQLKQYLADNEVNLHWAMVLVLEQGAFNSLLAQAFAARPIAPSVPDEYTADYATTPGERVKFAGVRFGLPTLAIEGLGGSTGEAVLRFPLVAGTYQVTGAANGVPYFIEEIKFTEGQGYYIALHAPLGAVGLTVDSEGRVVWEWPAVYEARTNLGTVPATRTIIASNLEKWLALTSAVPSRVHTHTLVLQSNVVLTPRRCYLAVAESGDSDGRYAVSLFATAPQWYEEGYGASGSPFLLPKANPDGTHYFDAAVYVEPLLKPLVQANTQAGQDAFQASAFLPLLSLLGGAPCMEINHWLAPGDAHNIVAFGQPRDAIAPPARVWVPVLTPNWVVRRIGLVNAQEPGHPLATQPVTFTAEGLGSEVSWSLSTGSPGYIQGTGANAQYILPDSIISDYYQVEVTATGIAGRRASAVVVLTPASYTLGFDSPLYPIGGGGAVGLTTDDRFDTARVLNGMGTVEAFPDEGYVVYTKSGSIGSVAQAVVVAEGRSRQGFTLIDLRPEDVPQPTWTALSEFTLECVQNGNPADHSSDRHYANGRQPVEVRVTIKTESVKDPNGSISYYPLTPGEISTLRLKIRNGAEIPFLDADEAEMSETDTRMFAASRARNRYDFMGTASSRAATVRNDPVDGTTVVSFYLLARPHPVDQSIGTTEFVAEFTDAYFVRHTSSPNTGGMVTVTAVRPPSETEVVYELHRTRPTGAEYPNNCTIGSGENADGFSQCLTSVDYWKLSYRPLSSAQEVLFLDCHFEAKDGLLTPLSSLARWESEVMEETFFSYTGYSFRPKLGAGVVDEQAWKHLTYDPWLTWLARIRDYPLEGPLRAGEEPAPGHLWMALVRVQDFQFWFDGEQEDLADPQRFKAFTARFGEIDVDNWTSTPRTLRVAMTDQYGNRHRLDIGFTPGSRNELQVSKAGLSFNPQAENTRLHSNAFNFQEFLEGGVDPRTGLYTASIGLPDVEANALAGPSLPLRLAYSPLNDSNVGFGLGWDVNLTRLALTGNSILSLHTGQQFKVTESGIGEWRIDERKLLNFQLHQDDQNHWRVVHIDGLVEYLERMDSSTGQVALPVRLVAPTGHSVSLTYEPFRGSQALMAMADDQGEVLRIERLNDRITLRLHPRGDVDEIAEFTLLLDANEAVHTLTLPVEEQSGWAFTYDVKNGYRFITSVNTPAGAYETLAYDDAGHLFPTSAGRPNLPRVTSHQVMPGQNQPAIHTRYRYQVQIEGRETDGNFLGGGQNSIPWADDGLDNLYKADAAYQYGTEQVVLEDGKDVRTTLRVFNAFHLLTLEQTTQNGHVQRSETVYPLKPGVPFRDQPAQFQLANQVVTRWQSPAGTRSETVQTDYDSHGNLLIEIAATGVQTKYTWYPATGEEGECPADPYGFVRYCKQTLVEPAAAQVTTAPLRVQRFAYQAFPALEGSGQPAWIRQTYEARSVQGQEATPYQTLTQGWFHDALDGLRLGRLEQQTLSHYDLASTTGIRYQSPLPALEQPLSTITRFTYSLEDSAVFERSVLKTTQEVIGFDGVGRMVNQEHSVLTGQVLLERDDNDVEMRYRYDSLQRVVEEIVAPGTEDEASRRYTYGLATQGDPAWQVLEDVQGVQFTTFVDGLARPVEQWRAEAGAVPRARVGKRPVDPGLKIFDAQYDALGQKVRETLYDDCRRDSDLQQRAILAMTTLFEYDDWGQERSQVGPDNIRRVTQQDPVGDGALPIVKTWEEVQHGTPSGAVITTVNNLFGDPLSVNRQGADGINDTTTYGYDGLGRKVRETQPWVNGTRETRFELDIYDRDAAQVLPDTARVERQYAQHSGEDFPVDIRVNNKLLGTQAFDGLGRMVTSTTGGRMRTMTYEASHNRPTQVTTPKGHTIAYQYQPRLGEEPVRRVSNQEETYRYDPKTARLMACEREAVEVMARTYFSNGQLASEQRRLDGNFYEMHYDYSVGERLLQYTDVTGSTQRYTYDSAGRLSKSEVGRLAPATLDRPALTWLSETTLREVVNAGKALLAGETTGLFEEVFTPELTCTLTYDELGRPKSVSTVDHQSPGEPYLTTTLAYDSSGREVSRTFDIDGDIETLTQVYDNTDCIVERTLKQGEQVLRNEEYEYDSRGHLSRYVCTGPECPVDPYGKTISSQEFIVDELDNHIAVITSWGAAGSSASSELCRRLRSGELDVQAARAQRVDVETENWADYLYDNEQDPVQLTGILNDHPDYPAQIQLEYDQDGNMVVDDEGRDLEYDPLGRLVSVSALENEEPALYHYDPSDIITGRTAGAANEHRFYREGTLATLVQGDGHVAIVRAGDHLIAERDNVDLSNKRALGRKEIRNDE